MRRSSAIELTAEQRRWIGAQVAAGRSPRAIADQVYRTCRSSGLASLVRSFAGAQADLRRAQLAAASGLGHCVLGWLALHGGGRR